MIVIERAPPYLTVQDVGRSGFRGNGMPVGGAMDQWSLAIANSRVGNAPETACLEWAIGGGSLVFEADAEVAFAGADVAASLDGRPVRGNSTFPVRAGQILDVKRLLNRRFLYLAIAGGIECPGVLGSRSTYLPASLGGFEGRRLRNGDRLVIGKKRFGARTGDEMQAGMSAAPDYDATKLRVIAAVPEESFEKFYQGEYTVSAASDRMGYRLETETRLDFGASITSEPVCAGVIQLPQDGQPIVLMADSPTIGGYRVIATVISRDLPILAQCLPGRRLRFRGVSVTDAQQELRSLRV